MLPGRYDPPVIWRGCDWPAITLIWKDLNGIPFNLSGWTPFAQLLTGQSLNPVITDPVNGVTTIGLTKLQSNDFNLGRIPWDWVWQQVSPPGPKGPPSLYGFVEIREPDSHNFQPTQ